MSHASVHSGSHLLTPCIPKLYGGDRLTRTEFERRFDATPGLRRAELIESTVRMPPVVPPRSYDIPATTTTAWAGFYRAVTDGVQVSHHTSLRIDDANMLQPSTVLIISPQSGGQTRIDQEGYIVGGPELVCEIWPDAENADLRLKMQIYHRSNVRELVVWHTADHRIDYFVRRGDAYKPMAPDRSAIFKSEVFPGLWLDPQAMFNNDLAAVLRLIQQGTISSEHKAFVAELAAQAKSG